MVLSDEKASFQQLKEYVNMNPNKEEAYDMCRAFDQLREEGRTIGRQEGEYQLNLLYAALVSQKRFEDLEKATFDETFRQKLYQEMQLA